MPWVVFFAVVPILFVLQFVIGIAVLFLVGRLFGVSDLSWRRVGIALAIVAVVAWPFGWALDALGLCQTIAGCVVSLAAETLVMATVLFSLAWAGWWRSLAMTIVHTIVWSVFGVVFGFGAKFLLMDSFHAASGGMVPALQGEHTTMSCQTCDRQLAIAVSRMQPPDPHEVVHVACPDCGSSHRYRDGDDARGDYFAVDRLAHIRRWDITAFRNPTDGSQDYVKRAVGLPGETVQIVRGDIFINGRRSSKPLGAREEMWVPLHDTRTAAHVSDVTARAWSVVSGSWTFDAGVWRATTDDTAAEHTLEFSRPIDDRLAYNRTYGRAKVDVDAVHDVRVTLDIEAVDPGATLSVLWVDGDRVATVTTAFEDTGSLLTLDTSHGSADARGRKTNRVILAIRDGVAHGLIGDASARAAIAPERLDDVADDSAGDATLQIRVTGGSIDLKRVRIDRDVHYRTRSLGGNRPPLNGTVENPIVLGPDEYFMLGDNSARSLDARYWGPPDPSQPNAQPGAVHRRSIIGRVRVRYWPLHRWRLFR